MSKSNVLIAVLAAALSAKCGIVSHRWGFVPTRELLTSNSPLRVRTCMGFCAYAEGIRDRYIWAHGSDSGSRVSATEDGYFDYIQTHSDRDWYLHTSSLAKGAFDDFVGVMNNLHLNASATNCTVMGFAIENFSENEIINGTTAVQGKPIETLYGGSALPEITKKPYYGNFAQEVNYARQVIGLNPLPATKEYVNITETYFNNREVESMAIARSNSWKVVNDAYTAPIANVIGNVDKIAYAYRGHGSALVEENHYRYERTVTYDYELTTNDDGIAISINNPSVDVLAENWFVTNKFGRYDTIELSAYCEDPGVRFPGATAVYEFIDGPPETGDHVDGLIYSRGIYSFDRFSDVNTYCSIYYSTKRSRILCDGEYTIYNQYTFLEDDQYPTLTSGIGDFYTGLRNLCLCLHSGTLHSTGDFSRRISSSEFGMALPIADAIIMTESKLIDSVMKNGDYSPSELWNDHRGNPSTVVEDRNLVFPFQIFTITFSVYDESSLVYVGYSSRVGGRITEGHPPPHYSQLVFSVTPEIPDNIYDYNGNTSLKMTHIGDLFIESPNLSSD